MPFITVKADSPFLSSSCSQQISRIGNHSSRKDIAPQFSPPLLLLQGPESSPPQSPEALSSDEQKVVMSLALRIPSLARLMAC